MSQMLLIGNVLVLFCCIGLAVVPGVQSLECTEIDSYNYLNGFQHNDKCESIASVFKYLHDMTEKKGDGTCRRGIISILAHHSGAQADHCQCSGTFKLHGHSSDLTQTCLQNHHEYKDMYNQFFTSSQQPCRTHHSLWTQIIRINDHMCQYDIVNQIANAFSQHDPCTCSEKHVVTTSSPHQQGQDQYDSCLQYYSYRELDRLVHHSTCMSANTVWHHLDDLQVKNYSCRKHIQDRLTSSYKNVPTNENNECNCTSNHTLTDKHQIHILNNQHGNYTYLGCRDHAPGSTYSVIERDLFTHITSHGCRNHNYLWPTLASVKDYYSNYSNAWRDCTRDLITRAALDYPSQDSDNCVCVHKTITSSMTTTTTSSTAQQATTPTTTTKAAATTTTTTTKSGVATTPQTTVSSHNENGWESWSPWTCKITKSDLLATCHNFRQRHCLSNMATDCEGSSSETMDCNDSQCSDVDITYVNCSLYNQYSTCEDQISCTYFSNKPWQICDNAAHVAQCPRLCTCCPIPTTSPTTTATQTTTPTTTTTTTTSSTTMTQPHSSTSSSTITASPTTTSTQTTTTTPKPEAVMTNLASTSTTMTKATPTASSTTTLTPVQATATTPRTTETITTQQTTEPITSTTTQQPSTTTPLRQCNHTCTLDAVILSMAVKNSEADSCSDKRSASNEALPMNCCNMGDHHNWTKGAQVQTNLTCTDGTPSPYTPIAAYNGTGFLIPDTAGIFYGCIKDGQSGFMMIHQTCELLPHLLHVDGKQGQDPNTYFMFQ